MNNDYEQNQLSVGRYSTCHCVAWYDAYTCARRYVVFVYLTHITPHMNTNLVIDLVSSISIISFTSIISYSLREPNLLAWCSFLTMKMPIK